MFGPVLAAWVYDVAGSCRLAFLVCAGLLLAVTAVVTSRKRPRHR